MAVAYINGGKKIVGEGAIQFSVVDYTDGTRSEIPNLPTFEDEVIEVEQKEEEKKEEEKKEEEKQEEQIQVATQHVCSKKSSDVNYGSNIVIKRHATSSIDDICLVKWHKNFELCKKFADKYHIPMVTVWSNGDRCGHCILAATALKHSEFTKFQQSYHIVWCYLEYSDSDAAVDSKPFKWVRGLKVYNRKEQKDLLDQYPFVNIYWKEPSGKVVVDVCTTGDTFRGARSGKDGAKKAKSYIKKKLDSKMKTYGYNPNS